MVTGFIMDAPCDVPRRLGMFALQRKERTKTMSFDKTKLFTIQNSYYGFADQYATLDEAMKEGKKYAAKNMTDVPIYKAVSLINAPLPTEFDVETLS